LEHAAIGHPSKIDQTDDQIQKYLHTRSPPFVRWLRCFVGAVIFEKDISLWNLFRLELLNKTKPLDQHLRRADIQGWYDKQLYAPVKTFQCWLHDNFLWVMVLVSMDIVFVRKICLVLFLFLGGVSCVGYNG
jgi:hypothetical protein